MTVHVIGAGLAGLSAAVVLAEAGRDVAVHEGAPHPGGRCRSYHDPVLGCRIDNGNHLVLSGNGAVRRYLSRIGAPGGLVAAPEASFPFADLATGERWTVRAGRGRTPLWLAGRAGRPPGMTMADAAGAARLALAGPGATVADAIPGRGAAWERFWMPMTLAVLNAPPERAQARLLWAALARSFGRGGRYCRPMHAPEGLGPALIDPAVRALRGWGAPVRTRRRLIALAAEGSDPRRRRAASLTFTDGHHALGPDDAVVLALPPSRLGGVMPFLDPPGDATTILNAHFRLPPGALDGAPPLLGVLGAHTHWIFRRGDVASVTISGAEDSALVAAAPEAAAAVLWEEVRRALDLPPGEPLAFRVLKEKRATFDQSPEGVARRLPVRTHLANVVLAGDHVRTGLPASIEGAVRSGEMAAAAILSRRAPPPRGGAPERPDLRAIAARGLRAGPPRRRSAQKNA